jgi:hypothetical protein
MNTTTATRNADLADVLAAGMPFPMRNALVRMNHASAVALFQARREFWLAAASGYSSQVAAGCADAAFDVADALAQAERYAA